MAKIINAEDLLAGGLLIGDEWVSKSSGGTMEHTNPATGKVQAQFAVAGSSEVDAAVQAARAALPAWRGYAPADRQAVLNRIAVLLREHSEEFARVTTLENGTPFAFAGTLASIAASWFDYYAGWVDKLTGDVIPTANAFSYTALEPYGVVAVILTWNGPTGSIGMKVAAALAAGCTVVLKPPELAPFSSSLFGKIALEAGLPAGVLNVVVGGPEAGEQLVRHRDVDKISFTGGPRAAAKIQAAAAESFTPLVLELGGKSANIVLEGADLQRASMTAAMGVSMLSGQVCAAPTRLIAHSSVHDQLVDMVVGVAGSLKVGDPFEATSMMGPLISGGACERVLGMVDRAKAGATLVTGGERLGGDLADGFFVPPTVFTDVDNQSELAQEEVFGPVLAVLRADDVDEAVALANDSRFGLAAYLHTPDVNAALRAASRLDAGMVMINGGAGGPTTPFGGFRDSGYGKEGGREGILEYLRTKFVSIGTT